MRKLNSSLPENSITVFLICQMTSSLQNLIALMRHAEAVAAAKTVKDFDRPLSEKGLLEAKEIGEILIHQNFRPSTVLCSPALRTRQTLGALHLDSNIKPEFVKLLYHGSGKDYVSVIISALPKSLPLLIIGHNPSISTAINKLCNSTEIELPRPLILGTANLALLEFSSIPVYQSTGFHDQLSGRGHLVSILKP